MESTYQSQWSDCLRIIRNNVEPETFNTFFGTMHFESYSEEEHVLIIRLQSQFIYEYVEEHFAHLMSKVLRKMFGKDVVLKYRILELKTENVTVDVQPDVKPYIGVSNIRKYPHQSPSVLDCSVTSSFDSQLSHDYTFENFIEGNANRAARAIGLSIAENESSKQFNPYFIFGPSGCGKTHLINSIGVRTKERCGWKRVLYISARLFQVQYSDAVLENKVNDFIAFYQTIDVLIVDDIQEWMTARKTQEVFYHIFNHLYMNGKRIILASDRPPVELEGLNERLNNRFSWGTTLEIGKPDRILCKDILRAKIQRDGLDISEEVTDYIANTVKGSVRNLEGIISSLMAYSVVYNSKRIDISLAESVIKRSVKIDNTPLTMDDIMERVAESYRVSVDAITGKGRQRNIAEARQTVVFLAQKHTKMAFQRIGRLLGGRSHSTILHSLSQAERLLRVDGGYARRVKEIERSFSLAGE
ncbi:MAG: chromosomal replication initiator protein DnaA [Bacteroidaceae bacterium]|nr:chromosomal replication initiator protein DnaA [Bacteroidaceae bacterium]